MYAIKATPYYFADAVGAKQEHYIDDDNGRILTFETKADAEAKVEELCQDTYVLEHGEYDAPSYDVIDLDALDNDCLPADGTELGPSYRPISADQIPDTARELLLAANVEWVSSHRGHYD